jgi:hypothetical protein
MDAIALAWSDVPLTLIERYQLEERVHDRGGEREIQFHRRAKAALLPVWHEGQLLIVPWGCRSGPLPQSGLSWQRTLDAGEWAPYQPALIEIPAVAGLHFGVWFRVRRGFRGLLVTEPKMAAYVLMESSTYYYRVMTRCEMMPVLVGERI